MKLVMFDMDGTLYRSDTSFFPAVHEFAEKYGFPQPSIDFLRGFIGKTGEEWCAWLESLRLGKPTSELAEEFSALERRYVETQGQLYPHAPAVLQQLKEDGWELGICSNAPAWYPEVILTRAQVRGLFSLIHVPQRSGETKAVMLCETWNELHPETCAMVGDRADDMQAAHAGGFLAIGAAYGWAPEELGHADVRINDISEVPGVLAGYHAAPAAAKQPPAEPVPAAEEAVPVPVVDTAPALATETPVQPSVPVTPVPAPPLERPAPSAPPVAPSVPAVEPPEPAPRRSWNPFRRREGKSR